MRPLALSRVVALGTLVVKLVLGSLLASHFMTQLFVVFLNLAAASPGDSPWRLASERGVPNAFPYGPVMYYAMVWPRWLLSPWMPAGADVVTPLHLFAARVPLLIADVAVLWLLVRRLDVPVTRTLALWWASPLVLYVTYVHGQLDLIPTAILLGSLVLLDRDRPFVAAVVLGLGIAAKTHLLVALPFMAVFMARRARRKLPGVAFAAAAVATYAVASVPWVFDPAFRAMVFGSEEQGRLFMVGVDYKDGLRLLLAPLAVWLLFLRFVAQDRPTRDTLFMFLGLAYTVMIALLPAAHGYYLWPLPFVVYFFAARVRDSVLPLWVLNVVGLAYLALGRDSTLPESLRLAFPAAATWPPPLTVLAQRTGLDVMAIDSLLFTLLQGSVLVIALMMYRHGVATRIIERGRPRPMLVGLGGDSGAGKHTARDLMADIVGADRVLTVDGDDVHRWRRGDPMWKVVSHLAPAGNDLYLQLRHAEALGDGRVVSKVSYDHATGRFTDPRDVSPRDFIFFVGLHPFYLRRMRELLDVKIFMDTDDPLRLAWKVARDVRARGYTETAVIEQVERRAADAERYIRPQRDVADLVVRFRAEAPADVVAGVELRFSNDAEWAGRLAAALEDEPTLRLREHHGLSHHVVDCAGALDAARVEDVGARLFGGVLRALDARPSWRADHNGIVQLAFLTVVADELARRGEALT